MALQYKRGIYCRLGFQVGEELGVFCDGGANAGKWEGLVDEVKVSR